MANEAADAYVDLVLFPEAALTGLINSDDPFHDRTLGGVIPGPVTQVLSELAKEREIYLGIGLLEREGERLFDSAVLFNPKGEIILNYRRIDPHWHGKNADPSIYCQGKELLKAETPFGTFTFLICGDLFNEGLVPRARTLRPDWLLFPFARNFSDNSYDQERWDREAKNEYMEQVKLIGVTTLMVNHLAGKSVFGATFGGAMVVDKTGIVVDSFPLGRVGILLVDL